MSRKNRNRPRPVKSSSLGSVRITSAPTQAPELPFRRRRRPAEPSFPGLEPAKTSWFSPRPEGMVDVSVPTPTPKRPTVPVPERPSVTPEPVKAPSAPVTTYSGLQATTAPAVANISLADLPPVAWRLITPELAAEWLAHQRVNRRISRGQVERLRRAIVNGKWHLTGEPVHRDKQGRIGNGQHRLTAIVEAGIPVYLIVVEQVPDEAFPFIDQTRMRTYGDHLRMEGQQSYVSEIASTSRFIWYYENDAITLGGGGKAQLGHDDLDDVKKRHPNIEAAARFVASKQLWRMGPRSAFVFAYTILSEIDAEAAEEFLGTLAAPSGMDPDSPILVLHTRLTHLVEGIGGKVSKTPRAEPIAALIVKAWNAWREGKVIKRLTWSPPEPFPKPI